ncbi:DNA-binding transcriptional ArsR family regulator [Thermocatellispora tengchongensis]|uniref:DNA-binding transcriptional ArsR family regulator n=1 Tax=Thermocatellispora tengchongensis TaxID=1073253 RepID=A0A840P7M8_9ACTN|nr:metalloregulator ArsR/SmtB family transcription factor [Thermocatellispora tengchongensis]MBB5137354.1 DNA-binding transcriptional ArsR family regulator [Thermocatellispora tengchongensis]
MFKALGDPIRWSIIQQIAQADELACSVLEDTLPVSKPTISYHTKILAQAGLIEVRKRGRNYYYCLQREALRELIDELWTIAPSPRAVGDAPARPRHRRGRQAGSRRAAAEPAAAAEVALLTW